MRGRHIPLPPGDWVQIGRYSWLGGSSGPVFTYDDAILARVSRNGVDALILARTTDYNGSSYVRTWGNNTICSRPDTYLLFIQNYSETRHECALLNHVIATDSSGASEVWKTYLATRAKNEANYPATLIAASFRFARDAAATTVTYYFGVEQSGFPKEATSWSASSWHRNNLTPDKQALVDGYKAWLKANFDAIQQATEQSRHVTLTAGPASR